MERRGCSWGGSKQRLGLVASPGASSVPMAQGQDRTVGPGSGVAGDHHGQGGGWGKGEPPGVTPSPELSGQT